MKSGLPVLGVAALIAGFLAMAPGPARGGPELPAWTESACWMAWFEHNQEWVLEKHFERTGRPAKTALPREVRDQVVLPLLRRCIVDVDVRVRDAAVRALGKVDTPETVPLLVVRTAEVDSTVQADALLALGLTGKEGALAPLREALGQADLRLHAILGLGLLGRKEAVPDLLAAYREAVPDPGRESTAAACAVALGAIGDPACIGPLVAPLRTTRLVELAVHVCQALGRIGGTDARDWLFDALQSRRETVGSSRDEAVTAAAALALSNYPEARVADRLLGPSGVMSPDRMTRIFSRHALARIGAGWSPDDRRRRAIEADLCAAAREVRRDCYQAMHAALSLALLGSDGGNAFFLQSLGKEDRLTYAMENHTAMAVALGLRGCREAIPELREILATPGSPEVRGWAAFALGLLGDRGSREGIRTAITGREKEEFTRLACLSLGLLGDPADVDVLVAALRGDIPGGGVARDAAALAIGLIGDPGAVPVLASLAGEAEDPGTRAAALAALGCLADRERLPRMPRLLADLSYTRMHPNLACLLRRP